MSVDNSRRDLTVSPAEIAANERYAAMRHPNNGLGAEWRNWKAGQLVRHALSDLQTGQLLGAPSHDIVWVQWQDGSMGQHLVWDLRLAGDA